MTHSPRLALFALMPLAATRAAEHDFQLVGSDVLPAVRVEGKEARIHVQGLYVTADHYFVTGRWETPPKRALLLRFDRQDPRRYQYLDLTPQTPADLDHPGGFDVGPDGDFWIPVARSVRAGPSVIVRVRAETKQPWDEQTPRVAFMVDDHIGAMCYVAGSRSLYGANWDTQRVYIWSTDGTPESRFERAEFVTNRPGWQLAVQDWKSTGGTPWERSGAILAGGIDKSPTRAPDQPLAVVELLDPVRRRSLRRFTLPPVPEVSRPLTNEGLAWHRDHLFLLPEDIGRGARVLRFSLRP